MNMNAQAFTYYNKAAYETASPEKLLIMLYDGAIKNIRNAQKSIAIQDVNLAHRQIMNTEEILIELMSTLNMDYEISKSLFNLYEYFYRQLVQANIQKDVELLQQIESFLVELREAWNEAMEKLKIAAAEEKKLAVSPVETVPVAPLKSGYARPAGPSNTTGIRKSINFEG